MRPISVATVIVVFCSVFVTAQSAIAAGRDIDFNRDIRAILFSKCVVCHGPDEKERAADLRLDTSEGAKADLGGYAALVPGDAEASEIILRVATDDEDLRMPPADHGEPLTAAEIELLRQWIAQGGNYSQHWSYQLPLRHPLPEVSDPSWPINAIDFFTRAKMEQHKLSPSRQADRLVLARRVAIDLTGLPPTWQQASQFAADKRANAYEHYVDSLLGSPAFGERWARVWLDLARYADSAGYADDPPRTIWAYRDYVIRALNQNIPFDRFTIEQIAGDLLPNPTEDQLIATAFHRNTLTNNEGGTNDEEFRNVAIIDRVNTTMAVWMGTTMACAQCHSHKYDPITQEEYFRFFAFFNNTSDADKRDESPLIEIWDDAQIAKKQNLTARIAELQTELKAPSELLDTQLKNWLADFDSKPDWTVALPTGVDAQREFNVGDDGWISTQADRVDSATYHVSIPTSASITGIQLEVAESQKENFVLSQVKAKWTPEQRTPNKAQFIRVLLPGKQRHLHLAEIQAFDGDDNLAVKGTAKQSSTYSDAVASRVNDGNTDGDYSNRSVQHTAAQADPWVEIDLGSEQSIDRLVLWNRTDGDKGIRDRFNGFEISLLDADRNVTWNQKPSEKSKSKYELTVDGSRIVSFAAATADFEQQGFSASSVIKPSLDRKSGWAIAPQTGKPHQLTLVFKHPLPSDAGHLLITMEHRSEHPQHLLDTFRFVTTTDRGLSRWAAVPANLHTAIAKLPNERSAQDRRRIEKYYREIAPALAGQRKELQRLQKQLAGMRPTTTVPVMRELPRENRRETKVQIRGNYQSTAETVTEGTPVAFHSLEPEDAPNRLDLARWLVDAKNPLTPRVIVNRHWEQLFGIGIVETSEEFGSQGELPTHPKLLDWLAVEFRESGWDVKRLIKMIVMSATYRQSSVTSPALIASDPSNRWLARGPRFRVSAEMVRDQTLFVSGLLSDKRFGPPVKPPQPNLGLKAAFGSATDWKTSAGEDRYRRGVYTTWRRSSPYPSMAQFDAPNREVCTVRRIRTNTPLQALVTLNDPVYVEAAQALARKTITAQSSTKDRLQYMIRRCLIREPFEPELERLTKLVNQLTQTYRETPDEAKTMATDPIGKLPDGADPVEHAAWTVVANVILNLDEMLMKR